MEIREKPVNFFNCSTWATTLVSAITLLTQAPLQKFPFLFIFIIPCSDYSVTWSCGPLFNNKLSQHHTTKSEPLDKPSIMTTNLIPTYLIINPQRLPSSNDLHVVFNSQLHRDRSLQVIGSKSGGSSSVGRP